MTIHMLTWDIHMLIRLMCMVILPAIIDLQGQEISKRLSGKLGNYNFKIDEIEFYHNNLYSDKNNPNLLLFKLISIF